MAGTWRIRHKMAFGMALVVGIMAILVTGALKGFQGYRSTMRIVESKQGEMEKAAILRDASKNLLNHRDLSKQDMTLKDALKDDVRVKLGDYRDALQQTIASGRAQDQGFREKLQLEACEQILGNLDAELKKERVPSVNGESPDILGERKPARVLVNQLLVAIDDLIRNINDELKERMDQSRREQRISQIILVSTSAVALVFMLGLLRYMYVSVVKPIRLLEKGVTRVARGDFEHRLNINSGDEIESFANAYNEMAGKLHEMYGDLANQVNERSRQLVRSERLAGVGFLAAGVAHEINNPLASIAFCSEALEGRLDELFVQRAAGQATNVQDRDTVHKYLKMIQEEAFRCKEITQKLLAFSRGGDRKREKTNLGEIIQGVLDMVQHVPNSKGKTVAFEPSPYLDAWVNGQEIKQVFLNLVVNALDSMDEGGTLTIAAGVRGGMVELSFHDTGCGMSEEILENIFEPFFTRSRTGKGTGLGLSISHRIITQHGGEIQATSAGPDQGSTFLVRLPIRESDAGDLNDALDPEEEFLKHQARQQRRAA